MNEARWIEQARQGDEAAWDALIRSHREPVFRLAYLLLGNVDDAGDIAQETFIRAYRSLGGFDAARPLRPWLLRIASNLARNRRRSIGRYWAALRREAQRLPPEAPDVGSRLEAQRLWLAVRKLSPQDQEMIYLRYFLDLRVDEAAQAADIAEWTVKSRSSRALKRLRKVLERDFPDLMEKAE
ncbi:MAG: RNA polymerase sigma factor [Anaerolineales bacterium]|nr:RNA polymerase sigma factor [Anaerolineales bacterium]